MRITIDIDDEEIRRLLAPLTQQAPAPQAQTPTKLLKVREVANRLGVSRKKVYEPLTRAGAEHDSWLLRNLNALASWARREHYRVDTADARPPPTRYQH